MECPHKECVSSQDCAILDITKKIPKKLDSCSYSSKRKEKKVPPMKKNKGFTLIELLVILVILAILGAVIAPKVLDRSRRHGNFYSIILFSKEGTPADTVQVKYLPMPSSNVNFELSTGEMMIWRDSWRELKR